VSAVWPEVRLGDVVVEARPGFPSGHDLDEGVFQFRMNNLTRDGQLDLSKRRRIPRDTKKIDAFLLRPGDVLFNATNSPELVGKSALIADLDEPAVFSNHFLRVRVDTNLVEPRFLWRWLQLQWQRGLFRSRARQWVNQATYGREALIELSIPLPSIGEQRRLAAVLDKADELRARRRASLEFLGSLNESIFLDMFGDPAANRNGYPTAPLVDLAAKVSDGPFGSHLKSSHYVDSGVRVIRLQNIGLGQFVDDNAAFISETHFASLRKHECLPGDVLVATLGDPNLRACIQPDWLSVALNKADCVQVRVDRELVTAEWLVSLLNLPSTERLAQGLVLGQTRARISMGRLRTLVVPVPPLGAQERFREVVSSVHSQRARLEQSDAAMRDAFTGLQHRAFAGQL
jgi:type I restriction enzyme S subunit